MIPARSKTPARRTRVFACGPLLLVEKHPAVVRWTHWVNFPLIAIMVWSGLLIYWADSAPGHALQHQAYRVGFGPFTLLRLFPDKFYQLLHLDGHLTRGLAFHALVMWVFTANGVIYLLFLLVSGQWRSVLPQFAALRHWMFHRIAGLAGRHSQPLLSKYNPGQRLAYTVVNLLTAVAVLTGFAIWKPTSLHVITAICGGYESARWLHFWCTIGICMFFLVHLIQVIRAGWNNLRSMIMGAQLVPAEHGHSHPPAAPAYVAATGDRAHG